MAERLTAQQKGGVSRSTLRIWGFLCLVLGTLGFAVIQNRLLNVGNTTAQGLLTAMENSPRVMAYATAALVLQAIHCCAAPLFAFLLVEGYQRTGNAAKYFLRVLAVAVLSELPYNLAVGGKWIDTATRNPAFGLVLAMVMLYFFCRYKEKSFANSVIKAVVAVAAVLWSMMLGIQDGAPLVVLTMVLWLTWKKPVLRMVFGCVSAFACSVFSPFYMLSPMVFILVHSYNGEPGEENVWIKHLAYPVMLLAFGVLSVYVL